MDTREKAEKLLEWAKKVPDDELLWTHLDILEVAQAYLNPWISVEERLPEKDGDYIVCFDDGKVMGFDFLTSIDLKKFKWGYLSGPYVAYWTYLPNPPKE